MVKTKDIVKLNLQIQYYREIPIQLVSRNYRNYKAKRFVINGTNQNVWIPNRHLTEDGTLKPEQDLDYVFKRSRNQCRLAGIKNVYWLRL